MNKFDEDFGTKYFKNKMVGLQMEIQIQEMTEMTKLRAKNNWD